MKKTECIARNCIYLIIKHSQVLNLHPQLYLLILQKHLSSIKGFRIARLRERGAEVPRPDCIIREEVGSLEQGWSRLSRVSRWEQQGLVLNSTLSPSPHLEFPIPSRVWIIARGIGTDYEIEGLRAIWDGPP